MPTQIASTPVLKGKEAKDAWKEANKLPSKKAHIKEKRIIKYINKFLSK